MLKATQLTGFGSKRRVASGAGHRYWRLNVSATNSTGAGPQISGFELRVASSDQIPTMTSGTTSGTTVTASNEFSATYAGWKACNDANGTTDFWDGDSPSDAQLEVDFGSGNTVDIDDYTVSAATGAQAAWAPNSWTLEYSDNGTDWTTWDTVSGETSWSSNETRTFS